MVALRSETRSQVQCLLLLLCGVLQGAVADSSDPSMDNLMQLLEKDVRSVEKSVNGTVRRFQNLKPPSSGSSKALLENTIKSLKDRVKILEGVVGGNSDFGKSLAAFEERLEQIVTQIDDTDQENKDLIDSMTANLQDAASRITAMEQLVQKLHEESEKKQLLNGVVEDIHNQKFKEAEMKLTKIGDGEIPGIVKKAYDHQHANFDVVLRLGKSVQNLTTKFGILKALKYEIGEHNHNDPLKLIQLHNSFLPLSQWNMSNETRADALEAAEKLTVQIQMTALEAVKDSWVTDRIERTAVLSEKIFEFSISMWKTVMQSVTEDLYKRVNVQRMIDYGSREVDFARRVMTYGYIVAAMSKNKDRNNLAMFTLAKKLKKEVDESKFTCSDYWKKMLIWQLIKSVPLSVHNAVFSPVVCIASNRHGEYLFSVTETDDEKRRAVLTWIPGDEENPDRDQVEPVMSNRKWSIEFKGDDVIHLKNLQTKEYLFAPGDDLKEDNNRPVFTLVSKDTPPDAKWAVEIDGPFLRFKNTERNSEYLHASRNKYNADGRYVYTRRSTSGDPSLWVVLPCH